MPPKACVVDQDVNAAVFAGTGSGFSSLHQIVKISGNDLNLHIVAAQLISEGIQLILRTRRQDQIAAFSGGNAGEFQAKTLGCTDDEYPVFRVTLSWFKPTCCDCS